MAASDWWQRQALKGWQTRGLWAWALLPLTVVYAALLALKRWFYRMGWLPRWVSPVPLLVVGNVVAGGTGKTPLLIALTLALQSRGLRVGLVSRGYGRTSKECLPVTVSSAADKVGDEPLLIHRKTGAPVWVAARRHDAVQALLAAHPNLDIVLCDDGLQHWAMAPHMALCAFDARGVGNGWLLPSGPLRERWPVAGLTNPGSHALRLASVAPTNTGAPTTTGPAQTPHFGYGRSLADHAVQADGTRHPLSSLRSGDQQLIALAGIGQPDVFFAALKIAGIQLNRTISLADHSTFDSKLLNTVLGCTLVCTEKDAVKLWHGRPDAWAVPLEVELPSDLIDWVLAGLHGQQQRQSTSLTNAI